ncbi:hypothetical protein Tco_0905522 [Tanacetum coccineum]
MSYCSTAVEVLVIRGLREVEQSQSSSRVLESIFKPSILGPLKCVSYVRQTEVFLFCERLPKIISATNLLCASLKIITAIDLVLERCGIANMAMYHVTREVSGGEGLVLSMVLFELQGKKMEDGPVTRKWGFELLAGI